jgi:hypothetical protein
MASQFFSSFFFLIFYSFFTLVLFVGYIVYFIMQKQFEVVLL